MDQVLAVDALYKSYGAFEVLKNISFDVRKSEGFVIIGPNGAGKSTLFKSLTGEARVNAGTVRFGGHDVTELAPHLRMRLGMARTFQVSRVLQHSTALDNVVIAIENRDRYFGRRVERGIFSWRPSDDTLAEAWHWLGELGLGHVARMEGKILSHGDRKKLEIAMALVSSPSVLMLDEPTAGMSARERGATTELLGHLNRTLGIALVLTEHDMDVVFSLADRILVLNYGEVIAIGTPTEVRADPQVQQIYLGQGAAHA